MNDHSASFPEYWSRRMQRYIKKNVVYRAICSFEESATLKKGDKVNRPYMSEVIVRNHTANAEVTIDDNTDTNESLTVDQRKVSGFYIEDFDELQSNYDTAGLKAEQNAVKVGEVVDGAILAEVVNADSSVSDGDFGGTAGNGVELTISNADRVLSKAKRKLDRLSVPQDQRVAVLSPDFMEVLTDAVGDRDTDLGDEVGANGYVGKRKGFMLHQSNNLLWTGELALSVNPNDGDMIVINGVTITFRATLGVLSGSVHIASTVDITRANLVEFLNSPTSSEAEDTDTGYVGFTAGSASEKALLHMTWVNDNTADTASVSAEGRGFVIVSETLTNAANVWTPGKQIQHNLACRKGAIEAVVQAPPKSKFKEVSNKLGRNCLTPVLYGKKSFAEGRREMVDIKIKTASWA